MELGSSEPGQFLQTCGREALRAGAGPRYHCTALMALVALVSKRPAALLRVSGASPAPPHTAAQRQRAHSLT